MAQQNEVRRPLRVVRGGKGRSVANGNGNGTATTVSERKAQHEAKLHNYNDTFLECRDLKHAWDYVGAPFRGAGGLILRRVVCARCKTERVDYWTGRGIRHRARYEYPDDYKLTGDHFGAQEVRQEILARFSVYETEDAALAGVTGGRKKRA